MSVGPSQPVVAGRVERAINHHLPVQLADFVGEFRHLILRQRPQLERRAVKFVPAKAIHAPRHGTGCWPRPRPPAVVSDRGEPVEQITAGRADRRWRRQLAGAEIDDFFFTRGLAAAIGRRAPWPLFAGQLDAVAELRLPGDLEASVQLIELFLGEFEPLRRQFGSFEAKHRQRADRAQGDEQRAAVRGFDPPLGVHAADHPQVADRRQQGAQLGFTQCFSAINVRPWGCPTSSRDAAVRRRSRSRRWPHSRNAGHLGEGCRCKAAPRTRTAAARTSPPGVHRKR